MEGLILTSLKTRSSIFFFFLLFQYLLNVFFCFLLFQYLLNERFYLVNLRLSALLFPSCAPCVSKNLHICFNLQKNIFFLWFVDNWIIPMGWSSWPTSDLLLLVTLIGVLHTILAKFLVDHVMFTEKNIIVFHFIILRLSSCLPPFSLGSRCLADNGNEMLLAIIPLIRAPITAL